MDKALKRFNYKSVSATDLIKEPQLIASIWFFFSKVFNYSAPKTMHFQLQVCKVQFANRFKTQN